MKIRSQLICSYGQFYAYLNYQLADQFKFQLRNDLYDQLWEQQSLGYGRLVSDQLEDDHAS